MAGAGKGNNMVVAATQSEQPSGEIGFQEMTLPEFKDQAAALTCSVHIPGQGLVPVLSELGRRILHGVMSCYLRAHEAGSTYNGLCKMDNLMVAVHWCQKSSLQKHGSSNHGSAGTSSSSRGRQRQQQQRPQPHVSRVYVRGTIILEALDCERQRNDYEQLQNVLAWLFGTSNVPLHVRSILTLLANLTALQSNIPMEKTTPLLQAYAAMVGPIAVATMCLNLQRFYDQLNPQQKLKFEKAMETAQNKTESLIKVINDQPLFNKVFNYAPPNSNGNSNQNTTTITAAGAGVDGRPTNQYTGTTGMELFYFARNWFTHVPTERWLSGQAFEGLSHLDHIFTYHFSNFMPEAILQLYKKFDDYDMITEVLVPVA